MIGTHLKQLAPGLSRAILWGAAAGALLFTLFCALNYASIGRDLPGAVRAVRTAFAEGTLQDRDWLEGNVTIGRHQYNDCLILLQAIDQRPDPLQLMASPLNWNRDVEGVCRDLHALAAGAPARPGLGFYHRYIHGHTMLARFLLPQIGVDGMRTLYRTLVALVVIAGAALSLAAVARGRRTTQSLIWLTIFLIFGRFFGLESFGQSLGHAPSDLIFLGYALFLAAASARGGLGARAIVIGAGIFGALTMIFEFLTGGIPLGMALMIGATALALREDSTDAVAHVALKALAAFLTAILVCILLKAALVLSLFGPGAVAESTHQFGVRIGMVEGVGEAPDLGPRHMAKALILALDSLGTGLFAMNVLTMLLAIASGLWGMRRLTRLPDSPARSTGWLLLGSNLALLGWTLLFRQHSITHAWFMDRIFAWTLASGFGLFILAVRTAPQHRT